MKVVMLNGSPHEFGCTHAALLEMQRVFKNRGIESEILWLGTEPIGGCVGCGACAKIGKCAFGGAVNQLAPALVEADGVVFGSPVHYAAASGALTSFMDRFFYAYGKKMAGKPACCVVSCRRGGASAAFDQINKYFTICSMPVVSGQYWNMVHGTRAEEVEEDGEGLQTVRSLAENMTWLLKCIEAGKEKGISFPEKEAPIRTNFIR